MTKRNRLWLGSFAPVVTILFYSFLLIAQPSLVTSLSVAALVMGVLLLMIPPLQSFTDKEEPLF